MRKLSRSSCLKETVLISTYWNVNILSAKKLKLMALVLISTYWNVNFSNLHHRQRQLNVLISTYWNVNIVEKLNKELKKQF